MPARLEVITGPMFSGKSGLLIDRVAVAMRENRLVKVLVPDEGREDCRGFIASRTVVSETETRISRKIPATVIETRDDLLRELGADDFTLLVVDEAHLFNTEPRLDLMGWFGRNIAQLLVRRKNDPLEVVVAGLDQNAWLQPFGIMPYLMAIADSVEKLTATCMTPGCGNAATVTTRLVSGDLVHPGDLGDYLAHCRGCHIMPPEDS